MKSPIKNFDSSFDTDALFEELKHSDKKAFLILGKPGVGKSYFLNEKLKKLWSPEEMILVGPTGTSAIHIKGKTINSFFNISIHRKEGFISPTNYKKIETAKVLVIDEISMCSYVLLNQVDSICKRIRHNYKEDFGGLILFGFGDTAQLPPVPNEDSELERYFQGYQLMFYKANVFKNPNSFSVYELTKVWRQKESSFLELLNRIRDENSTKEDISIINQNYNKHLTIDANSITLTTTNRAADSINKETLLSLGKTIYTSKTTFQDEEDERRFKLIEKEKIPEEISLSEDIPVIFYRNDTNNTEMQYSNGTLGRISKINTDGSGEILSIFVTVDDREIEVLKQGYPLEVNNQEDGEYVQVNTAYNFPLKPAWGLTVWKVQGLTIPGSIKIYLGRNVPPGLVYVAISRATKLSNITIEGRRIHLEHLKMRDDFKTYAKQHGWQIKIVH